MSSWLTDYWWLFWAVAAVSALVVYRMRTRGGSEHVLRRIMYALLPASDPVNRPQRQLSLLAATLIGGGLLLALILNLVLREIR